ncbi:type II methionyl aminopeptidase [Candidatus Woesearchaeota archaeon CG10_big_fil_rev_8_21_14_0_10_44_13]|nr:MAG: type II methionyl aminopeptidase [Candidatus Woesearchaeota archaeon CG10_big_fil_rev_8_21_14_0_10_44_13]
MAQKPDKNTVKIEGLENYRKAGKIAAQAIEYGRSIIKIGASLYEVCDKIESKIISLGGKLAFPTQTSLNEVAAHYCSTPDDKTVFKENDLVKLDLGVHVDGYVADTAISIDLSKDKRHEKIIKASEEALANAIKTVKPGTKIGEIGKAIQDSITKYGYAPVRNLGGHGVGRFIVHGPPSIPNIDTGDKEEIEEGMIFAIEPFASAGAGVIYERENANVFMVIGRKGVRNMITRRVLAEIDKFEGLPFTERWLVRKGVSLPKINYALRELDNLGILRKFPPLPDKNKGLVSQAEHTVIVTKGGCEVITK